MSLENHNLINNLKKTKDDAFEFLKNYGDLPRIDVTFKYLNQKIKGLTKIMKEAEEHFITKSITIINTPDLRTRLEQELLAESKKTGKESIEKRIAKNMNQPYYSTKLSIQELILNKMAGNQIQNIKELKQKMKEQGIRINHWTTNRIWNKLQQEPNH